MKTIIKAFRLFFIIFALSSCEGEINPVKDFTDGEELRYPGKPTEAIYRAGNNRLEIQFTLNPDPNITKALVYWNMKEESITIDIDRSQLTDDKVLYIIDHLPENVYSFEIYTEDKFGNRSVPEYMTGRTYGSRYHGFLTHRLITGYEAANLDGDIHIHLGDSVLGSQETILSYTNLANQEVEMTIANTVNTVTLENANFAKPIKYKTLHLPEPNAIDVFEVAAADYTIDPEKLVYELPKPYATYFVEGFDTNNGNYAALWNGKWGKTYSTDDGGSPWGGEAGWAAVDVPKGSWITMDLGRVAKLQRYRTGFYWPYRKSCPQITEIWAYQGTGAPTAADGWDHWVKMGEINNASFIKNQDDMIREYPIGDNIYIDYPKAFAARYYRVKFVTNWDPNNANCNLAEMTFWIYVQ